MTTMTRTRDDLQHGVIGGVDTHRDTHTAAVIDPIGRLLEHHTFPATAAGYRQLLTWMRSFGTVQDVGVEGTGAYGNGLTNYLTSQGVTVIEVDRPRPQDPPLGRQVRPDRRRGRSPGRGSRHPHRDTEIPYR